MKNSTTLNQVNQLYMQVETGLTSLYSANDVLKILGTVREAFFYAPHEDDGPELDLKQIMKLLGELKKAIADLADVEIGEDEVSFEVSGREILVDCVDTSAFDDQINALSEISDSLVTLLTATC